MPFGEATIRVIPTPGNTPACNSFLVENMLFVGHDYGPGGRPIAWETTIEKQKKRIFILITAFKFRSLSQYEKHGMLGSVYLR